jgi:TonB family protein
LTDIDEEDAMKPRNLSIWSATLVAGMTAASLIAYGVAASVPAVPQQPRDPRPQEARPAADREKQLAAAAASAPQDRRAAQELAKLQEGRGALAEAEATLRASAEAAPGDSARWQALAALQVRAGQFERAVETLEGAAERDPSDAAMQHLVATFYVAKLTEPTLRHADRMSYIERGLAAEDRALAVEPDLLEALVHKSLLLRALAEQESSSARRAALIQQSDELRLRAAKSQRSTSATWIELDKGTSYPAPPPPPPVPGAGPIEWVFAETSFAAADGASTPKKVRDVRPVYPPMVIRMGVEGRVVVQAAIDARGYVVRARVVESIPFLDSPTIDAVRQWRFDPSTVASGAAPVMINVEARFFRRK